ncbi:aldo/keto reductase [Bacillus inaquosorum]|uniref:aldo/keto reductase n=1 Tax=Bacillus inaquosorum TaxID=483913 RepID=UPI00227FEC49|nr:aldo/keto reductase [Bacillus inaquosorum]MCY9272018.1 aldo/keto reductase [Bacillus inaquosorum]
MKNVNIGKTGLNAFNIGLGAGVVGNAMMYPNVTEEMGKDLIHAAFDEGIDFIDTAYLYGLGRSEKLIGEAVKQRGNREKIVISTKVSPSPEFVNGAVKTDIRPSALRKAADEALIRLQTDYIDILFLHFPDSRTPLGEAADALAQLKKEGKIRAVGASNLDFHQLQEFNAEGHLDVFQTEYSLLVRHAEEDILPYCREKNISVIPFYPLASGLLAGRYKHDDVFTDVSRSNHPLFQRQAFLENLEKVEKLKQFAEQKQAEPAQIALAWLLHQPGIDMIIPGATLPEQLRANLKTADIHLSEDDLKQMDRMFGS